MTLPWPSGSRGGKKDTTGSGQNSNHALPGQDSSKLGSKTERANDVALPSTRTPITAGHDTGTAAPASGPPKVTSSRNSSVSERRYSQSDSQSNSLANVLGSKKQADTINKLAQTSGSHDERAQSERTLPPLEISYTDGPDPKDSTVSNTDDRKLDYQIRSSKSKGGSVSRTLLPFVDTEAGTSFESTLKPPRPPSYANSFTTDNGPPIYVEGGRKHEAEFLSKKLSQMTPRNYRGAESVVSKVRKDLTDAKSLVEGAMDNLFITSTTLYHIMSSETVELLLREIFPGEGEWTRDDVQRICPENIHKPGLRRIFAVFIIWHKQRDILKLLNFDPLADDCYLPALGDSSVANVTYQHQQLQDFFHKQAWDHMDIRNFWNMQWEVSPIFFSNENRLAIHYQCRSKHSWPLMHHGRIKEEGGYGKVTSYLLHSDQQSLKRYTTKGAAHPVVLKKSKPLHSRKRTRADFNKETAILRRLTRSPRRENQHLAKLLATLEVFGPNDSEYGDYYMMFECADMTLEGLFEKDLRDSDAKTSDLQSWAARQIHGLAAALHDIHHYKRDRDDLDDATHGFHGDLKPSNILLYTNWKYPGLHENDENPDSESDGDEGRGEEDLEDCSAPGFGILQITDFGTSSFHHTLTAEDIQFGARSGAYSPPELQLRLAVSASLDIWSLACLYLEMLSWILEGPDGLKRFRMERAKTPGLIADGQCFYVVKKEDHRTVISVSDAVLKWATQLHFSDNSSRFTRELLELILSQMLVIEQKGSDNFNSDVTGEEKKGRRHKIRKSFGGSWKVLIVNRTRKKSGSTTERGRHRSKVGPGPTPPDEARIRTSRIDTRDLMEKLKELRDQDDEYYMPSAPQGQPEFLEWPRHKIIWPHAFTALIDKLEPMEMRRLQAQREKMEADM